MQRIAIVDPSDVTREPLRNLLLGVDSVWIEAECTRYEFFPDVIQQSSPDVVMVALDSDQNKAMQLISHLAATMPSLPVLAISGQGDGQSILKALRAGAKEFLTQPVVLEDMVRALQRLVSSNGISANGRPANHSQVVAFLGTRGGVGCTSLAVNLGCAWAVDPANSAALIDLDLALGDADVALDLLPTATLAEVARSVDRMDMQFLKRSMCAHSSGLSLLTHPLRIDEVAGIHEEHLQRIINLLRASYSHLILDLSKSFTPTDITALRMADVILLVAQCELTSLRNAVRILMTMEIEPGMGDKVKVVINRVGSDFQEGDISLKKAEETIGRPIFWQVPNDSKAMIGSRNAGVPLVHHAPRSKAHQSMLGLARLLDGKDDSRELVGAGGKKSRWWG